MNKTALRKNTEAISSPETAGIALVVLNVFAVSAKHFYAHLSEGASISTPEPAYEAALELLENTRLGGSVIWINAEGVTLDELAQLEKHWLPIAGKAIMLIGTNQVPMVNRSLQGLMAARRENASFQAAVLTPKDSMAATTCRLMASQSGGWLHHEVKNAAQPLVGISKVLAHLQLHEVAADLPTIAAQSAPSEEFPESPAAPSRPAQQASAQIIELPLARSMPSAQEQSLGTADDPEPQAVSEAPQPLHQPPEGISQMTTLNDSMAACMQIDGALGAALCDYSSGMALAKIGGGGVNLDMAAAGNTEVLKAKLKTMSTLGIKGTIEDMLITLDAQYHLIRPVPHKQGLFLYLVLDKMKGNLAMARFKLMEIEKSITV